MGKGVFFYHQLLPMHPDAKAYSSAVDILTRAPIKLFNALKQLVDPRMEIDGSLTIDPSLLANCKPHHRQAVELALTDLYGRRHEALIRLPASCEKFVCEQLLNDKRDLLLFLTFVQVTLWHSFSAAVQLLLLPQHNSRGLYWMPLHLVV